MATETIKVKPLVTFTGGDFAPLLTLPAFVRIEASDNVDDLDEFIPWVKPGDQYWAFFVTDGAFVHIYWEEQFEDAVEFQSIFPN